MIFDTTNNVKTSRFNLPVVTQAQKIPVGTWYAILEVENDLYKKLLSGNVEGTQNREALQGLRAKGVKYCLSVHSFSNLRMICTIDQDGFIPGSTLLVRASLTEYNRPVEKRADVSAELEFPDHTQSVLPLHETAPGVFEVAIKASHAGIYRFRLLARGGTYQGIPFTREQILTAAVFHEIKYPPVPGGGADKNEWCRLFECLLNEKNLSREFAERLKNEGINLNGIFECIKIFCKKV